MLDRAKEIINDISKQTDEIILFHSLSGKDSITLLELCYPRFSRIVCVYMYLIPNLEHIKPYYAWAKKKYPNTEWLQVPHYGWYSYKKTGYMGMEADPKQRKWTLSDIIDKVRERTGIQWCCLGFKQSDSLNRRLMLRSYKDGKESISWKGCKFYPLSTYNNKAIRNYIIKENLKTPETYGSSVGQSCGASVTDYFYLKYLSEKYPNDLQKVYDTFPATRIIIENYETERNNDNQAESD